MLFIKDLGQLYINKFVFVDNLSTCTTLSFPLLTCLPNIPYPHTIHPLVQTPATPSQPPISPLSLSSTSSNNSFASLALFFVLLPSQTPLHSRHTCHLLLLFTTGLPHVPFPLKHLAIHIYCPSFHHTLIYLSPSSAPHPYLSSLSTFSSEYQLSHSSSPLFFEY